MGVNTGTGNKNSNNLEVLKFVKLITVPCIVSCIAICLQTS